MLDDLAETFPQKVKLIKIDIEGFEYEALKGASKLLSRKVFDSLLVEIHPATLEGMKQSEQDIDKLLESCGYTKRKINNYLNYYFFEDQ